MYRERERDLVLDSKIYIWNYIEKSASSSTMRPKTSIFYEACIHFKYGISHAVINMREAKKGVMCLGWLYWFGTIMGLPYKFSFFFKLM